MVKMNTTLKHKKKNNVKKNSNKNKSNKNKKTTRQKKYYRRRKYSRKMKGGKVCIKSTGQCLTVVGKYGDASSANKSTTTIIDEDKNVITLTPVASSTEPLVVDDGSGSGAIQTSDIVVDTGNTGLKNVDDLSAINLDLENNVADTKKLIQENGDILTSITPGSDIEVSENVDEEIQDNNVVDQVEDKTTSSGVSDDVNAKNVSESTENNGNEVQGNISREDDNYSASGVSDVVSVENKNREQLNPVSPNGPPPPPNGLLPPLPPQPPITQAQGNNVSTDNNNTEIDSIGNIVPLNLGEDGSSESTDNQNIQPSHVSITNNENNIKPLMNNRMVNSKIPLENKSETPLENNSEIQVESKTERFPENNMKEVFKDILKNKGMLRSRSNPDLRSKQKTRNNSLFNQQLVEQVRNQQSLNFDSESLNTNNDDWDTQGGKTRRRRSIKKNKKNSKSKKQSKKMRKNKKTRK
jgi:hypothetical protein